VPRHAIARYGGPTQVSKTQEPRAGWNEMRIRFLQQLGAVPPLS